MYIYIYICIYIYTYTVYLQFLSIYGRHIEQYPSQASPPCLRQARMRLKSQHRRLGTLATQVAGGGSVGGVMKKWKITMFLHTMWGPQPLCTLVYLTMLLPTINPSEIQVINQLNAILEARHCNHYQPLFTTMNHHKSPSTSHGGPTFPSVLPPPFSGKRWPENQRTLPPFLRKSMNHSIDLKDISQKSLSLW